MAGHVLPVAAGIQVRMAQDSPAERVDRPQADRTEVVSLVHHMELVEGRERSHHMVRTGRDLGLVTQ